MMVMARARASSVTVAFYLMLANSLADSVPEEASKSLQLDLNLEHIWAKSEVAGEIYELDFLLELKEVTTQSSIERLVGELGNAGHLFVRHNSGMRCLACNTNRACRQYSFWSKTPCILRPCSVDVIASFSPRKRQHGIAFSPNPDYVNFESSASQTNVAFLVSLGANLTHPPVVLDKAAALLQSFLDDSQEIGPS